MDPKDGRKEFGIFETAEGRRTCDAMERGSISGLADYQLIWARRVAGPELETQVD